MIVMSSGAVCTYDARIEHPEGGWLVNKKELEYVLEKNKDTREYPDETQFSITLIIPIKIESDDKIEECDYLNLFLLDNFDTTVMVKEVDDQSRFVTSSTTDS